MDQSNRENILEGPPLSIANKKSFVDEHPSLIVRGGIITTGLLCLGIYLKTSPTFRRFKHVNQIPKTFFEKEIVMKGIVKDITPTGKFVVQHLPLVKIAFVNTSKNIKPINVNLAGVELSEEGLKMITKDMNIVNKTINFKVIKPTTGDRNCVDAEVIVKTTPLTSINLSQDLVRKGFAKVPKPTNEDHAKALETNMVYGKLIGQLLTSEKIADRRGIGVWERQSWVENIQTVPEQTIKYVKNSPIIKFGNLTGIILKDAFYVVFVVLSTIYHTALATAIYTKDGYIKLANIIKRMMNLNSNRIKRRIEKQNN